MSGMTMALSIEKFTNALSTLAVACLLLLHSLMVCRITDIAIVLLCVYIWLPLLV